MSWRRQFRRILKVAQLEPPPSELTGVGSSVVEVTGDLFPPQLLLVFQMHQQNVIQLVPRGWGPRIVFGFRAPVSSLVRRSVSHGVVVLPLFGTGADAVGDDHRRFASRDPRSIVYKVRQYQKSIEVSCSNY